MTEYDYVCSDCGQQISVNEPMRTAILENGCPICSASAESNEFSEA